MGLGSSVFLKQWKLLRDSSRKVATTNPALPPEIMTQIISHCGLTTLLRMRLVSKKVRILVDSSSRLVDVLEHLRKPSLK